MIDHRPDDEDEIEFVPVPMDRETRRRLAAFERMTGDRAVIIASKLLHDVLRDDEFEHMNPLAADEPDPKLKPN